MTKFQPKKNFQIQRMFGLAKPIADQSGQDVKEYLESLAFTVTMRTERLSELSFDEANDMIEKLGGNRFVLLRRSRRTENYRKQQAGIKTIETDAQLKLINDLAAMRGWTAESLVKFCQRVIKKDSPTTTEEGNKIAEGLKAMNQRDGLLKFKRNTPATTAVEPSFRRVA